MLKIKSDVDMEKLIELGFVSFKASTSRRTCRRRTVSNNYSRTCR